MCGHVCSVTANTGTKRMTWDLFLKNSIVRLQHWNLAVFITTILPHNVWKKHAMCAVKPKWCWSSSLIMRVFTTDICHKIRLLTSTCLYICSNASVYSFTIYLMSLSTTQIIKKEELWMMNCNGCRRMRPNLKHYLNIYTEEMRKPTKNVNQDCILVKIQTKHLQTTSKK